MEPSKWGEGALLGQIPKKTERIYAAKLSAGLDELYGGISEVLGGRLPGYWGIPRVFNGCS